MVKECDTHHSAVHHPEHYTAGAIECIDAIRAALTPEEFRGYCKGNAIKYVWRERLKGGAESIAKAGWYIDKLDEPQLPFPPVSDSKTLDTFGYAIIGSGRIEL